MIYKYFQAGPGHSRSNAYLLALLSYYIYKNEVPEVAPVIPGDEERTFRRRFRIVFGEDYLSSLNPLRVDIWTDNTEFAILSNAEWVIVCFRGSDEPLDWVSLLGSPNFPSTMIIAPPNWGPNVRVHKGFYDALDTVYPIISNEVRNRMSGGAKLFLTGHSRGGALANLCAYRLQRDQIHVSGVYTFGAPRVGDQNFRAMYESLDDLWNRTFRMVRNDDPGPKWPDVGFDHNSLAPAPYPVPHRYYHVGYMNFVSSNGQITMNFANPDHEPGPELRIGDHDMFVYCTLMFLNLRNHVRENEDTPNWLVKQDVPNGLPHLSPGMV
jgi:hypothetical protein